ncbi:MAG: exosortase/archaeosortase family protein [Bacteroidales bacterium]
MKRKLKKISINDIPSRIMNKIEEENKAIKSNEKKQLIYFVLGFIFFYLLLSFTINLIPQEYYKQLTSNSVEFILNASGIKTTTLGFVPCNEFTWFYEGIEGVCHSFLVGEKTILIAWLCTGILEIIILVSAIIASFGLGNKEKLIGVILAIIVGVILNLIRIIFTIQIVLTQNIQVVEFVHDFLFKLILFVYITVFYVAWFYWAKERK